MIYGRAGDDEQVEAARELASFWRYAAALVEARTESPGDDFVSVLTQAGEADGDALSREETVSDNAANAVRGARDDDEAHGK